ncbi:MAG: phenylalanine--tRNA ligase subunit beta [Oligoflexia bacterium]|nr:phenylalanine--tRNA ligase subunit beta [Oligoflexia bacterium]
MKISLKWLTKYIELKEFTAAPEKLADILTNGGLEVEGIANQAKDFDHIVVGQILEKGKHPQADNLTLCKVTTGEKTHQIICGAKNHNTGDKVVVSLPGAVLPGNFAIKISKIRGIESQGMLCSDKELGLGDSQEGILILPANAPLGESFAKYAKLDDVVFDIKVTPNRADCLSHFGLAREISGLTGKTFEFPVTPFTEGRESTRKLIKVAVEDVERCPRYAGRVVQNIKVGPSPEWLKKSLESVGLRSINNVVDVTNFVMLELGQPLHAFDLNLLDGKQIIIRTAEKGEKFTTLDDKKLEFDGTELLICDLKNPIALAGVMGGLNSGVSDSTTEVFVESAYFLPSTVRRSSRRHGIDSDSSYRFSRGVDPDSVILALNRACQLLTEVAQGTVCADHYDNYPRPVVRPRIEVDLKFISARLGMTIDSIEAKRSLERIGCDVSGSGNKLLVNPPAFRGDLKLAEDLGEEILRLKGFANIPETLPSFTQEPTRDDLGYLLEYKLAYTLQACGLHQAVNLSFTSSKFESDFLTSDRGQASELGIDFSGPSVKITNPLNAELDVMRVSVVPSLVRNALHNMRHAIHCGGLFEIAPVFRKIESPDIKENRPFTEETHLAFVQWGQEPETWVKQPQVSLFYKSKGILESFLSTWQYKSFKFEALKNPPAFLHPGQSARVFVEGKPVGFIGVLHPMIADKLEVKSSMVIAELNLKTLFTGQPRLTRVKGLPKFPSMQRDVALLVPQELSAGEIKAELQKAAGNLASKCEIFDIYMGDKLPADKKSLAFRMTYQDPSRTLSDEEINASHQKTIQSVCQKFNLSVR